MLHEAWVRWAHHWQLTDAMRHRGIHVVPHLPVPDLDAIIDGLATSADDIEGRLVAWQRPKGWHEPLPLFSSD
jgi:hypothetical protein